MPRWHATIFFQIITAHGAHQIRLQPRQARMCLHPRGSRWFRLNTKKSGQVHSTPVRVAADVVRRSPSFDQGDIPFQMPVRTHVLGGDCHVQLTLDLQSPAGGRGSGGVWVVCDSADI